MPVRQLRLVVTPPTTTRPCIFYRDVLGFDERDAVQSPGGRVVLLDAGQAALELAEPSTAEDIDEVEVGRRVTGHIRVAFEVDDAHATTTALAAAGGQLLAAPRPTPFRSTNARRGGPAGLQLTLFQMD
ncbi:VOC family protein [Actinophytocola sp.]|uniref:VOC family protein n=1 Tax=Actinophytocola sp. TaxID=1872138 RepID=UPI003D6AC589